MSKFKEQFIKSVEESLVNKLPKNQLDIVMDEITKVMSNYDITKDNHELITYVDVNGDILKRFCACLMIEGKSPKTIRAYSYMIKRFIDMIQKHFTDVGVYDIRLFLAYEKQRGISNRSLENTRAYLSAFFQWMEKDEIIPKNPCSKIPPIKYTEKVKLPFSPVEIDAMRLACKNTKERALVEFLLSTGVRLSELTAMKVSDIDWQNLSVHVTNGKGAKERTTYMTELAKTHLISYIEQRKEDGDCLFYNKNHEQLCLSGVRYILSVIAKRSEVNNVHPHRFRRTFASGLAARGMDIQEIKKLLGHTDINTTMKYVYSSDVQIQNSYKRYIV